MTDEQQQVSSAPTQETSTPVAVQEVAARVGDTVDVNTTANTEDQSTFIDTADIPEDAHPAAKLPIVGLSAEDAKAAIDAHIASLVEQADPANKTYYPYAEVSAGATTFNAYTGKPVVQPKDDPAPENASEWAPPEVADGYLYYMDPVHPGWVLGIDITKASLEDLQSRALTGATETFNAEILGLQSGYSAAERQSWAEQVVDAQAFVDGGSASALLTALADARGLEVKDVADRILAKNTAYKETYAQALGAFQKLRDQITGAKTVADLPPLTLDDIHAMPSPMTTIGG